ncbi:MAG: hypothetical protein L3J39_06170 [Verrucomicrobiales bacterium]|nr:hypothetical protein [Verrucomicrobiales bacterium]
MKRSLTPIIINQNSGERTQLEKIALDGSSEKFDEAWIQQLVNDCPDLLPIDQIDSIFGDLIPLCREMRTKVGPLDNLFINQDGMLTLVECKLWRNPEARRKVVAQILDYAQAFSQMTYEDLSSQVCKAAGGSAKSLYALVADSIEEDVSESVFHDRVVSNLQKGRFLLLIVGDGIRQGVIDISDYLQNHAHLNFAFGLVSIDVFRTAVSKAESWVIIPTVQAKTVEIERAVIRIEENASIGAIATPTSKQISTNPKSRRRGAITEQVFFERLAESAPTQIRALKELLSQLESRQIDIEPGASSLLIKATDAKFIFVIINTQGQIKSFGMGGTELGEKYIARLARLFSDGKVQESKNKAYWSVRDSEGNLFEIEEFLKHAESWLSLVDEILDEIR